MGSLRNGRRDPTVRMEPDSLWKAAHTPEGPVTVHLSRHPEGCQVRAWGEGAAWSLARAEHLLGLHDRPEEFLPGEQPLRDLALRFAGMHLARQPWVADVLVGVVLAQRVSGVEAKGSFEELVRRHGEPAPGPADLRLPVPPKRLAALSLNDFFALGVDRQRALTLKEVGWYAKKLDAAAELPFDQARRRLLAVRGIGPWTTEMAMGYALGDPDALVLGDYNLPHTVAFALTGQARGDDELMARLLEPYRGHRFRALRLLKAGGIKAPRRGPRMAFPGPPGPPPWKRIPGVGREK